MKDGGTCNIVNNAGIKQSFFKCCNQDIYIITKQNNFFLKDALCYQMYQFSINKALFKFVPKQKQILLQQQFMAKGNMPLQTSFLEFF